MRLPSFVIRVCLGLCSGRAYRPPPTKHVNVCRGGQGGFCGFLQVQGRSQNLRAYQLVCAWKLTVCAFYYVREVAPRDLESQDVVLRVPSESEDALQDNMKQLLQVLCRA